MTKDKWEGTYASRRKKVLKQIANGAALFPAASPATMSRDQSHPYRQNSDFFYLTGIQEPSCALVLLGKKNGPRSILYLRDRNRAQEIWEGERLGFNRAKRRIDVDEIRDIADITDDLPELLTDCRVLHYALGSEPRLDEAVVKLMKSSIGPRYNFPNSLTDSRLMLGELRFVKDRKEITTIKHAVDITAHAFFELSLQIGKMVSEIHAAQVLESFFARLGATSAAFPTIVASGKNATYLHHHPKNQPLWKRELVLVDAGAFFRGYAGDVTRTLPVSGKFSEPQAAIYDIVHRALQAGINEAAPDSSLEDINSAAVAQLTKGLVNIGILKGKPSELISSGAYKRYYPHRTSHWLGLDVHDISPVWYSEKNHAVPSLLRPLVPGNVLTIEPGLYFDAKDKSVPKEFRGVGVRIEDDILITPSGCKVLSSAMPSAREDIEALLAK